MYIYNKKMQIPMSHKLTDSLKRTILLKLVHDSTWFVSMYTYVCIYFSGGPLSTLTCCVNVRLLSGDKKNIAVNLFSKLGWELGLFYASYDDFHLDILARMYT